MADLTEVQVEVLSAVIEQTRSLRCPPTATHVNDVIGRDVRTTLKELKWMGYIAQPLARGPVVPLRSPDGARLRLELVEDDPDQEPARRAA